MMSIPVFRRRCPAWLAAGLISCSTIGCALGGGSTYPEGAPAAEAVDVPSPGVLPGREADRGARELRDRESSFFTALADRDAERVAAHFADDAMLHIADMPPIQGRDAIGTFYSSLLGYLSATTSISETLRVSDSGDLAYTTGSVTNIFEGGDGRVEYPGKYLLVWERRRAGWEVAVHGVSSNQPDADGARQAVVEGAAEIRVLGASDAALMERLLTTFGAAFGEPDTYGGNRPRRDYLERLLNGDSFIALAATKDGGVVGGLAAYELRKYEQERSEFYIYDLAVAESHRRQGIATALIGALREVAAARGAWVIFVQADPVDDAAVALYTKLGVREDVLHFDIAVDGGRG